MLPRKARQMATPVVIVFDDDEDDETFATSIEDGTSLDYDTNEDEKVVEDRETELVNSDSQDEDATDEVVEYDEEEEDEDHKGNGKGHVGTCSFYEGAGCFGATQLTGMLEMPETKG